ncbi:hypothetical protein HYH03_015232 [Edaphochlamys debaryana]|uniref:Uncharacterized protein n=1 Tax=Edaphochlamys debaryana TaxID=47281 RepID=A0A835XUH6_9CHLO|nr:hypothetical protein HYH03_015232 [Edaphochlamys debaryana]|eukprot:KAG2486139.1 hypothetical protein HYH03_015232 [Edaphochlamys debaryana]
MERHSRFGRRKQPVPRRRDGLETSSPAWRPAFSALNVLFTLLLLTVAGLLASTFSYLSDRQRELHRSDVRVSTNALSVANEGRLHDDGRQHGEHDFTSQAWGLSQRLLGAVAGADTPPSGNGSAPAPPAEPPPIDCCRRCATFSASDFEGGHEDAPLLWRQDPDWVRTPPPFNESDASDSASASAAGDTDVRRAECRRAGPFLHRFTANELIGAHHARVIKYIRSPDYRYRAAAIAQAGGRGILISAGGPRYTAGLLVTLHVLRHHFDCWLPVEVAWQGQSEMDAFTWAAIEERFGPVRGFNVRAEKHPVEGLHGPVFDATSYSGKVYALVHSRFKEVLMLDADATPLMDPTALFEEPRFREYGSLFWPDAWTDAASPRIFRVYGVDEKPARAVLRMGMGTGRRDTESGQLLIDRSRHLDVIEMLLFLNRHPDSNQGLVWGDKDTTWLAFAMAGKAHCFNQVAVPPGGIFSWAPDRLLTKVSQRRGPGWLLNGFVQFIEDEPFVYGITKLEPQSGSARRDAAAASEHRRRGLLATDAADDDAGAEAAAVQRGASAETVTELGNQEALEAAEARAAAGGSDASSSAAGTSRDASSSVGAVLRRAGRRLARAFGVTVGEDAWAKRHKAALAHRDDLVSRRIPMTHHVTPQQIRELGGLGQEYARHHTPPPARESGTPPPAHPRGPPARPDRAGEDMLAPLKGLVRPAFLHRTLSKMDLGEPEPRRLEVLTAPMFQRWASYYLAHDNPGPTRGVPWDFAVPDAAISPVLTTWDPMEGYEESAAASAVARELTWRQWNQSGGGGAATPSPQGGGGWLWRRHREPWWGASEGPDGDVTAAAGAGSSGGGGLWSWLVGGAAEDDPAAAAAREFAAGASAAAAGSDASAAAAAAEPPSPTLAAAAATASAAGIRTYLRALDAGLPLDRHPPLEAACRTQLLSAAEAAAESIAAAAEVTAGAALKYGELEEAAEAARRKAKAAAKARGGDAAAILAAGTAAAAAKLGGVEEVPHHVISAARAYDSACDIGLLSHVVLPRTAAAPYAYLETRGGSGGGLVAAPAGSAAVVTGAFGSLGTPAPVPPPPLPALRQNWSAPWPCGGSPVVSAVRASYRAFEWESAAASAVARELTWRQWNQSGGGGAATPSPQGGGGWLWRRHREPWWGASEGPDGDVTAAAGAGSSGGGGLWSWLVGGAAEDDPAAAAAREFAAGASAAAAGRRRLGGGSGGGAAIANAGGGGGDGEVPGEWLCPMPPPAAGSDAAASSDAAAGADAACPLSAAGIRTYLRALDAGLPLDRHPPLEAACRTQLLSAAEAAAESIAAAAEVTAGAALKYGELEEAAEAARRKAKAAAKARGGDAAAILAAGTAAAAAKLGGVEEVPHHVISAARAYDSACDIGLLSHVVLPRTAAAPYAYLETRGGSGGGLVAAPAGSAAVVTGAFGSLGTPAPVPPPPLPALRQNWSAPWPCGGSPVVSAVRASYRAFEWVKRHRRDFPILNTEQKKGRN